MFDIQVVRYLQRLTRNQLDLDVGINLLKHYFAFLFLFQLLNKTFRFIIIISSTNRIDLNIYIAEEPNEAVVNAHIKKPIQIFVTNLFL